MLSKITRKLSHKRPSLIPVFKKQSFNLLRKIVVNSKQILESKDFLICVNAPSHSNEQKGRKQESYVLSLPPFRRIPEHRGPHTHSLHVPGSQRGHSVARTRSYGAETAHCLDALLGRKRRAVWAQVCFPEGSAPPGWTKRE